MKIQSILKYVFFLTMISLLLTECKKDEGQGGTSSIKGRVIVHDFSSDFSDTLPKAIYQDENEDTYIIYGTDHTTYDDDYKSSYDGSYEFKFLQKGTYRLFVYTKDTTGAASHNYNNNLPKIPVFVDVTISSNGTTVTAPDLIVLKNNQ